jgi:signal transduction histidine kinase
MSGDTPQSSSTPTSAWRRGPTGSIARRLERSSVGGVLAATIGVLLLLAVVGIGLALLANAQLERDRNLLLDQVGPAVRSTLELESALVNEETGVRGYIITAQSSFLGPYQDGLADEAGAYANLHARERAVGPAIAADIELVRARARMWRGEFVTAAVAHARQPVRHSLTLDLQGRRLFDSVREALTHLQKALTLKDTQTRAQLNSAAERLQALLIVAAVLVFGGVIGAGFLLRAMITRPLALLGAQARRIGGGEFAEPLTVARGPREIAEVGSELNVMRERIVAELAKVETARAQLEEQAAELKRSNMELEQFAYVASHDLQEPLRKIASFCQALRARYHGQLDERADQYIDFAVDGAKRMQTLINDLLAFSRAGRSGVRHEPVDLGEALSAARAALAQSIEEAGGRVEADALPVVRGDRTQLTSLLQNLIANAIKFRGVQAPVVRIEARREGAQWLFSCADNGIGIEGEYAERIFLIFQRLHSREAYEGSGIGLALCRKIVEYHGGTIWLDTDYSGGARFCFTLPVTDGESLANNARPAKVALLPASTHSSATSTASTDPHHTGTDSNPASTDPHHTNTNSTATSTDPTPPEPTPTPQDES